MQVISGSAAGAPVAAPALPAVAVAVYAGVPAAGPGVTVGEAAAPIVLAPDREPVDVTLPLRFDREAACVQGHGMAVHLARQLVIVAGARDNKLHCYNLSDGKECIVIGRGRGGGNMQFRWNYGGLCVTPRGTLLVADRNNHRVPEVHLGVFDRFARVFGQGDGAPKIDSPDYVDCNGVHVAVSETAANWVCVLSYADGSPVGRVSSAGSKPLLSPHCIKLLADGSGVVVADCDNDRVVLLPLAGNVLGTASECVQSHVDLKFPIGIVQCVALDGDVAVMVTCYGAAWTHTRLTKIGFRSGLLESVDEAKSGNWQFSDLSDIATLPGGGLVVLEPISSRFLVFASLALRKSWILLVVSSL